MKNDIFNLNRFGKYVASDIRSYVANCGLSTAIMSLMGVFIYLGTVIMGVVFNYGTWEGPQITFRTMTFIITMFVMVVNVPVKCYGLITEKKAGSAWLMIPVSSFEKLLSMIIITCIIAPVIIISIYLGTDALLCSIDTTSGVSIISQLRSMFIVTVEGLKNFPINDSGLIGYERFIQQVSHPMLYIDDFLMVILVFLAGGVIFKKGKTTKTILAIIAVSSIIGILTMGIFEIFDIQEYIMKSASADYSNFFNSWVCRNIVLTDTISDTAVNLILIAIIYFRIKKIQH